VALTFLTGALDAVALRLRPLSSAVVSRTTIDLLHFRRTFDATRLSRSDSSSSPAIV
jgi:hypothetical protein